MKRLDGLKFTNLSRTFLAVLALVLMVAVLAGAATDQGPPIKANGRISSTAVYWKLPDYQVLLKP